MRYLTSIVLMLLLAATTACTHNWGNFRKLSMEKPEGVSEIGGRVSGEDCRYIIGRWWWNSVAAASRKALEQAPEATALVDVEVSWNMGLISECIEVEGTPVK